jgi:hypothetical protein
MLKNITLSAEEELIEASRLKARQHKTTLNQLFRDWLVSYTGDKEKRAAQLEAYRALRKNMRRVKIDRKYTREELNAR